jgi:hypothetical protein
MKGEVTYCLTYEYVTLNKLKCNNYAENNNCNHMKLAQIFLLLKFIWWHAVA